MTDTKQAFLYGDMGDERIFVSSPDWWQQTLEEGQVLTALNTVKGTKQAQPGTNGSRNGYMPTGM